MKLFKKGTSLFLATAMLASLSTTTFAAPKGKGGMKSKAPKACKRVNLTPEQRAEVKKLRRAFRLEAVDLRAAVKKAKLQYRFAVLEEGNDLEVATQASNKIARKRMKLLKARKALQNEILMNVLEVEQRRPMMRCMKQRELRRKLRKIRAQVKGPKGYKMKKKKSKGLKGKQNTTV